MSRLKVLAVTFNSRTDLFSPGDAIEGQVIIQVDSNSDNEGLKNVQGIWVKIIGKCRTHWITSANQRNRDHEGAHSKKEVYFDTVFVAFGNGKRERSANKLNIPPGTHAYPFSFLLPNEILPASFEHEFGYVRYKVKATLSLIRTFSNKTFKREKLFCMTGPMVDLNTMLEVQSAVNITKELFGWCGCGSTVEESITIGLPKQGYVPGESLYVTGLVDNRDREESCNFCAKFIQKITFRSQSSEKKHVETILGTVCYTVPTPRGRVVDFSLGPILIPPVPPSGLPACKLIDIQYRIQCKSDIGKWEFPITIGTVPLRAPMPTSYPNAPPANTPYSSAIATAPDFPIGVASSAPPFDDEAPPPSYEQAIGQINRLTNERNDEDYFRDDQFVPSYPYFNLSIDVPPDSR